MGSITLLDDATRPKAPKIAGLSASQRSRGRHLAFVHRMHLGDLDRARRLLNQIESGEQQPDKLGPALASMQMTGNYRAFGSLCGQECEVLTMHHSIEDASVFPPLRAQGGDGLAKVLARLSQEHGIIHELLEQIEVQAVEIIQKPGSEAFAALKVNFLALERLVRSHFGYEETELEDALSYYEIGI